MTHPSPVTHPVSPGAVHGARVLVTGGAGAVGSAIVDRLVRGGAEVRVLDTFARGTIRNLDWAIENGTVEVVEGDLRDRSALRDAIAGSEIVIHQAAIRVTQCAEEPRLALEVMVDGTFNVLELADELGVQKVVAASSAALYGEAEDFPTGERHHNYNDRTFYGAAKSFNEAMLRSFHEMYGLDYVVLRYFNLYGPRIDIFGDHREVLVRWMERIDAGRPPLILGDGSQTMDFVHIDDAARATVLAAASHVTDEVFNVASGRETSLRELAGLLLGVMGSDLEIEFGPERAVNGTRRRLGDPTKAREMLGFVADRDLESGVADLVDWWREARLHTPEDLRPTPARRAS